MDVAPYVDRVQETTTTTGTGAIALGGPVQGYEAFSDDFANGNRLYYCITNGTVWEIGAGTYNSGPNTISRDLVIESSNGDALVNFPAGGKLVFSTFAGVMMVDKGFSLANMMAIIPQ
jgi:hypothetical protein